MKSRAVKHSIYHKPGLAFISYDSKAFCCFFLYHTFGSPLLQKLRTAGKVAVLEYTFV